MLDNNHYNASGADTANIITGSAQAAGIVAQTISNIIDQGKRRKFEQSLALLSNKQMQELNEKMLKAQTETDRLNILSQSLVDYAKANEKSAQMTKVLLIGISGLLAVSLLVVAFLTVKAKKQRT